MARGMLLPVISKRFFDFGALQVGVQQQIVVAERIDISRYIDCVVGLRLHNLVIGTGDTAALLLFGDGPTSEDPGLPLATAAELFAAPSIVTGATAPALLTYGGTVRGRYAALILKVTHGQAGAFNMSLSAELVMRCPGEEDLEAA